MTVETPDIIDLLVGIAPGSRLDAVRARHVQARDNAQASYVALFHPHDSTQMSPVERAAVAVFVAGLHRQVDVAEFYRNRLLALEGGADIAAILVGRIALGTTHGPYGHYPSGPLSVENVAGQIYKISKPNRSVLGPRLSAALEHTHFLVFRPRDAAPAALQALLESGWSTTGIVTFSQLVAFLAFQIRVVAGLQALAA